MSELLTLQDLANGHLDVKALGEAANGDENKQVVTRTGETYPSAKKAIKQMFENGGIAARFKTLVELQASPLVDGDYALVADDSSDKNGIYIKEGGVWSQSKYTENLKALVIDNDDSLLRLKDLNGKDFFVVDELESFHVSGKVISNNEVLASEIFVKSKVDTNDDERLLYINDSNGNPSVVIDDYSNLHVGGSVYSNSSKLATLHDLYIAVQDALNSNTKDILRKTALITQTPTINKLTPVSKYMDSDGIGRTKRMPSGIKTDTGLLIINHQQVPPHNGDGYGAELWKSIITVHDDLSTTIESHELLYKTTNEKGVYKHPMLGRTKNDRIVLVVETTEDASVARYEQYIAFSDDEGLTFTPLQPLNVVKLNVGDYDKALGSTGRIITMPSGRLVMPMYTYGKQIFSFYSDDNGASWSASPYLSQNGEEPGITIDKDGNLLMDIRPPTGGYRMRAISKNGGESWQVLPNSPLLSVANQGSIYYDDEAGVMLQTHNNVPLGEQTQWGPRNKWTISLSYDNSKTYPDHYQPFHDNFFGGYSQIIKWDYGVYFIALEYAQEFTGTNKDENTGVFAVNLNGVLQNVDSY